MYVIKSNRIGVVGTEYKPKPTDNINGLLFLGFIEKADDEPTPEVSTTSAKKGAKNKKATKED